MPLSSRPIAGLAALLLTSCAAVGPDFDPPPAPIVAGYAMAGDPTPRTTETDSTRPWWTVLGSPTLDAIMAEALAGNPTIFEADAALDRAHALAAGEQGAAVPQAEVNAGAQREKINTAAFGFTGFPSPTISLYSVGAGVSYDLDLFGGRRRMIEAASADAETERHRAEAARLALTGAVALQALRIAALTEQIDTVRAIVVDDQRLIDMVRRAEAAGGSPHSAVLGGQTQLAEDEGLLPPLERDLAAARHQLAVLVGKSPAEWTAPDFRFSSFGAPEIAPPALPSQLVRRRPDVLAAEAALHAATARIGVARAAQFPDVRLTANLAQGALETGKLFHAESSGWAIGGALVGPLFDGGTRKARRQASEAEARAALARYHATVLRAFGQVSDALAALAADERAIDATLRAERTATANLKDAEAAFRLGGGSQSEVVDAQRRLGRARRASLEAQGRRWSDIVELRVATAAPWRDER